MMKDNTPPTSPYNEIIDDEDDELVYVGDADEVLESLMAEEAADQAYAAENNDEDGLENEAVYVPERDDAVLTFKKHIGAIFSGSLHPTEGLAVTGGEDDKAYVWNMTDAEVVFEVTGHGDSVIASEFSYDGIYLATGDMAGLIQVFKVSQNYKKVWEFAMGDMCWMRWHFGAHVLLAGAESGEIYIWRIPSGDCKVLQGFGEKCETAKLTSDGKKIAAGYGDGTLKIWDIKTSTPTLEVASNNTLGHSQNITSISIDRDNQMILTGCEEGKAVISGQSGPVGTLNPNDGSVEAVLIDSPDFEVKVAATGTLNGKVTVWDVSKQTARVQCEDPNPTGITKMLWGKDSTIIAGTLGGVIKVWDLRSGQLKYELLGHANDIHNIFYNKDKNIILSVSEDGAAKIFNLQT